MLAPAASVKASVTKVCSPAAAIPAAMYQTRKRMCPNASSTLLPKIQRNSMLPAMCSQLPCRNIELKTPSYQGK